jgi:hypothetical protein
MQATMIRLFGIGLTAQMRIMIGVVVALVALCSFVVGLWVGGRGRPEALLGPGCDRIRADSTRLMDEARRTQADTPQHRLTARTALYQVIDNRGCFSPQDLATAQAALDEINIPRPTPLPQ